MMTCHPLNISNCTRGFPLQSSPLLNNRNRINGEDPPERLPAEKTEIPSSTSKKQEK